MMNQLKFAIEDVLKNKSYFIRFLIQITCVLILLGVCVTRISSTNNFKKKFDIFQETSQLYIIRDQTDLEVIDKRFEDSNIQEKLYELYSFILTSKDIQFYSYYDDQIIAENDTLPISYIQYQDDSKYYPLLYVDQNFWNIFKLNCSDGKNFTQNDFLIEQNHIPVLLGYQYRGYYNIGDIIDHKYFVAGILEKDAFYLDPGKTGEILYLAGTIVAPLIVNEETPFYQLDRIITSGTIIVDDAEQLKRIEYKSINMELYDKLEFISFSKQLENIIEDNMIYVYFEIVIQCLILFFCIMCIISALINFINLHKKEFAVHILCGACAKDLSLRIVFQIISCLFTSNIITFIFFGFSKASLIIFVVSIILLLLIVTLPVIKIMKKPLASFLNEV